MKMRETLKEGDKQKKKKKRSEREGTKREKTL